MSRGLGTRQRLLLQALRQLEQQHSEEGCRFHVWAVLQKAWDLGLKSEIEDERRRRLEREQAWRADITMRAEAGDPEALRLVGLDKQYRALTQGLRRTRFRGTRRDFGVVEHMNPSRTMALLQRRGLVERGNAHANEAGQGAWVRLTDTGRGAAV